MRLKGNNVRVLFAGLAVLGLSLAGAAETRAQESLSPELIRFLQNLPPAAQQQALTALDNLTPASLQALERRPFLNQPEDSAQFIANVHASLPWGAQQRFMNSFFGGPGDEQFAESVCRAYTLRRVRGAAGVSSDAGRISDGAINASRAFRIR